jgi:hypothetical protein
LFINGLNVTEKVQINHLDRITLGHANAFKLIVPGKKSKVAQQDVLGYGQFLDDKLSGGSE